MENIYKDLTAVLMQELFEGGNFDFDWIARRYGFNEEMATALKELYTEYYGEE